MTIVSSPLPPPQPLEPLSAFAASIASRSEQKPSLAWMSSVVVTSMVAAGAAGATISSSAMTAREAVRLGRSLPTPRPYPAGGRQRKRSLARADDAEAQPPHGRGVARGVGGAQHGAVAPAAQDAAADAAGEALAVGAGDGLHGEPSDADEPGAPAPPAVGAGGPAAAPAGAPTRSRALDREHHTRGLRQRIAERRAAAHAPPLRGDRRFARAAAGD